MDRDHENVREHRTGTTQVATKREWPTYGMETENPCTRIDEIVLKSTGYFLYCQSILEDPIFIKKAFPKSW